MQSKTESLAHRGHRYEPVEGERCSVAVVNAVAEAIDSDPLELPQVLGDVIDADALDALVEVRRADSTVRLAVSFEFCGCTVEVAPDGVVLVRADSVE
ncbi:HalOD1 output domain-containing protein [Halomarina salina]|uniref:HalOD1 output domain-containing protein n=1 Tax=Halomarina salina TaxID=1872699 RepID=A0ABD5RHZ5_9EURY|nr:HalOD1 output domain-containing protein [Halomarina salina]